MQASVDLLCKFISAINFRGDVTQVQALHHHSFISDAAEPLNVFLNNIYESMEVIIQNKPKYENLDLPKTSSYEHLPNGAQTDATENDGHPNEKNHILNAASS